MRIARPDCVHLIRTIGGSKCGCVERQRAGVMKIFGRPNCIVDPYVVEMQLFPYCAHQKPTAFDKFGGTSPSLPRVVAVDKNLSVENRRLTGTTFLLANSPFQREPWGSGVSIISLEDVVSPAAVAATRLQGFASMLTCRPYTKLEWSWLYRSSLAPLVSLRWSSFVGDFYQRFGGHKPATPVLRKPLVEYAIGGISPRARLSILLRHYEILTARFRPAIISDLCAGRRIPVLASLGKGEEFQLWMGASDLVWVTGEGEIVLCLEHRSSGIVVAKLTVLFDGTIDRPILVIGGLRSAAGMKESIVKATRKLYGLRPKDALLLAARSFASSGGFSEIHAISNERHVERRGGKVYSDFDAYWRDRGARVGGNYGFVFGEAIGPIVGDSRRDNLKRKIVESGRDLANRCRVAG